MLLNVMNRISPLNESDFDNSLEPPVRTYSSVMTNKDNNSTSIPKNSQNNDPDLSPSSRAVVITIKDESTSENHNKNDSQNQVSALVRFIKSSFSSNKKKSEPIVVSPKLLCHQKLATNQSNNQIDNPHSDQSNCNVNLSVTSSNDIFCRFCQEFEPENELVTPCLCSGTLKHIHQSCLQRWIKVQDNRVCELCKYEFRMKITSKPLREWQKLEMSVMEKRKIICSVTFHIIALTCVIWSLYVLIERTTEEIHNGVMEWPLWTKLIVVAIGFIGGVVFMYVQCRMYVSLCRKWHVYNRTFVVQSISPMELLAAQKEAKIKCDNYRKNVHYDRTNVFGDVSIDNAPIIGIALVPIVRASNEELDYTSPSETEIQDYREKMFSDEETSYIQDTTYHSDMVHSVHTVNAAVSHRVVDT